ncbi:MAG: cysteine desulfurase family protein [Pseudomonadota bacterium]
MGRSLTYLDYNATAPLRPEARSAMIGALDDVGNPSSVHGAGRAARGVVETARRQVASALGRPAGDVTFTSGATEANNMAIRAAQVAGFACLASAVEHESVRAIPGVTLLAVDRGGRLDLGRLEQAIAEAGAPVFLSLMAANNETGVLQPVEAAAEMVRKAGGRVHCDAVQAAGRIGLDSLAGQVDSLSLSAHKLGGPQGVGALISPSAREPEPLMFGGAQEDRRRAGTENVAGIAGFGAAIEVSVEDLGAMAELGVLRDRLEAGVRARDASVIVAGQEGDRLANTSCMAVPGLTAETQVMALDLAGFAISSGSACSSGKVGVSPVLTAMGFPEDIARNAIRVSLGWQTTPEEIDGFVDAWSRLRDRHGTVAA